jgi:hypothetical protein
MSVWNRIGDLAKGTADWIGDVGLSVVSAPKFIWDVATAPLNPREEYNGFFNSIQQAGIDWTKNVARPIGGVLAAIDKTNQNLIREPLSALLVGSSTGQWSRAWENRNKISFGQAAASAGGGGILGLLPDSITPEFMDSNFDIFDEASRKRAFQDSVYGRVVSGLGDTTIQLFGDVSIIGGKFVKAQKAADSAFEAVKAIREAKAFDPTWSSLASKEALRYDKLAQDFAANDAIWAANHPWVKASNNEASVAYLLGITTTKEEALSTMQALLGDKTGISKLDELKRPDITEPLRIANGELSRSELKVLLNEERKIVSSQEEGMLPLTLRTPEEIAADREFIVAWAKHDKYVDKLFELSAEAPFSKGISKFGQVVGRELAIARTVPFHSQEVGAMKTEVYQPTPFHKLYSKVSSLQGERPSGMVNLNEGDSIREVTAIVNRLVTLSKTGNAITRVFNADASFTFEDAAGYLDEYAAAASPEARGKIINALEHRGYKVIAEKYGIDADTAVRLYDHHVTTRSGKLREAKEEGFLFDAETNTMIKVPIFESQTANILPVADFDTIDKVLRTRASTIKAIAFNGSRLVEEASDLWKASVLLRLGYPVRNAVDSQLRIMATVGAMTSVRHFADGSRNLASNISDSNLGTRIVDRFKRVEKLDYKSVKNSVQELGREIEVHKIEIEKYNDLLNQNPGDLVILGKLTATQSILRNKLAAYEANSATLGKFESSLTPGAKKTIAQGEFRVSSVIQGAEGIEYKVYDAFGSPNGGLYRELNSSERSFTALLEDYSKLYGANVGSKGRGIVRPEDTNYYTDWARTINEDFANSTVARQLVEGKSPEDVAKLLEENQALRARLGIGRDSSLEHVYQVKGFVDNYIPQGSGIREQMIGNKPGELTRITPEFLRNAIKNPDELPTIHGHLLDENLNAKSSKAIKNLRGEIFKYLGTMPENAWARHPLFVDLYQKSIKERIATMEQLNGGVFTRQEFDEIQYGLEKAARADALKGVKGILYNVERRTNAAQMLRFVSPFFSAQENAVKTWLKIASDNPVIVNRAALLWTAPNRIGIATDENGNQVPKEKALQNSDTMWFEVPGGLKKLPIIGKGLSSLDRIGVTKQSLDVAFQGNPFGVSVGPLVAVPASQVMKMVPELSKVIGFAFPYGPDASIKSILPTYLKRGYDRLQGQNSSDYAKTYQLIWLTEQHKARDNGTPYLSEAKVKELTDSYYSMRAAANFILPFAPQFDSPYKYYIDKWHEYSQTYGIDADAKFLEDYPDFFEFSTSMSKNPTGSNATMDAVQNAKQYSGLISELTGDNPQLVGLITNNAGAAKFNPTAYWWQEETSISAGTSEKFRGKSTPAEAIKKNEARKGWAIYRKMNTIIDAKLAERGLTSVDEAGAEDLKYSKQLMIQALATNKDPVTGESTGESSAWYEDYKDTDGLKSASNVAGLRKIVTNPKFMADNGEDPTWKSVAIYLQLRDKLASTLSVRPSASIDAKGNADLKYMLDSYVSQLKAGDLEFADIYERFLSQDKIYDKYLGQ